MHVIFNDAQFDFQTLRLLGSAASGDAEAGEVLSTANRIAEGDFESWTAEWLKTAQGVHEIAEGCRERGHRVSAREAYFRASNYSTATAEFYLHGDPKDPRIIDFSRKSAGLLRAGARPDPRGRRARGHPVRRCRRSPATSTVQMRPRRGLPRSLCTPGMTAPRGTPC